MASGKPSGCAPSRRRGCGVANERGQNSLGTLFWDDKDYLDGSNSMGALVYVFVMDVPR